MSLPFSQACENNKQPILNQLKQWIKTPARLLEIGAGTGQHAVYFARQFPMLIWQATDVNTSVLEQQFQSHRRPNLPAPKSFHSRQPFHDRLFDYLFTANTLHIMSEADGAALIQQLPHLIPDGLCFIYGPFKYQGQYTSQSNADFDHWLKARDPMSGIRDIEWLQQQMKLQHFDMLDDVSMPANNQWLIFKQS